MLSALSETVANSTRTTWRPNPVFCSVATHSPDIDRMLSAAREEPSPRQRMFWPTRDAALLRFLATTGARAEEACGVTIGELDRYGYSQHTAWAPRYIPVRDL